MGNEVLGPENEAMLRLEATSLQVLAQRDNMERARMEEQFAMHCQLLERAERREQLSFLDAVALEAKTDAKKAELELANQRRVEEQLASLQKRQEIAEDAGRKRW